MTLEDYRVLRARVVEVGYVGDINWSETVAAPTHSDDFALEAIFVICNSGMKATIARPIYERVRDALTSGGDVRKAFGHAGKVEAIKTIWRDRASLFTGYYGAEDKLAFLVDLPWIGNITKYHLARNFGADVAKPDRHLERLAKAAGTTPQKLCERLAQATGDRVGTVDYVLWRAAERGWIEGGGRPQLGLDLGA